MIHKPKIHKRSEIFIAFILLISLAIPSFLNGCTPSDKLLIGAGASFPFHIYHKWGEVYNEKAGIELDYDPIGSSGGIQAVTSKNVDFGGTDAPLTPEELRKNNLIQFPMIVGGVVVIVNEGINSLEIKISGQVLADIFLGEITRWDDPKIKQHNPGLQFPDKGINVVYRKDGSGTTWIFTNYLSQVSKSWRERVGFGKTVNFPVGTPVEGSDRLAALVNRINYSIGYVEYTYSYDNKLTTMQLQNLAGQFVRPSLKTFQDAAAYADWEHAPGFYLNLNNQIGENTWPIVGASFILTYINQENYTKAANMLNYFNWCFQDGKQYAEKLYYIPIPDNVIKLIHFEWEKLSSPNNQAIWKN